MKKLPLLYLLVLLCTSATAFNITINTPQNSTYFEQINLAVQATTEVTWQFNLNSAGNVTIGTGSAANYNLNEVDGLNSLEVFGTSENETKNTLIYFTVDLNPPSAPVLNLNQNNTQIELSWTASTDSISTISQYLVYRNGINIANTSNLIYSDNITPGSYTYTVRAMDATNKLSEESNNKSIVFGTSLISTNQLTNFTYAARTYNFEATSTQPLSQVNLILNENTYPMQLIQTNTYTLTTTSLSAGTYAYYTQGNLINGSTISSEVKTFTIDKAQPQLTTTLNGITYNITVTQGDSVSIYARTSTNYNTPLKLTVTGRADQIYVSPLNTTIQILDTQNLTVTTEFAGDNNYTSEVKSIGVQIRKDATAPEFLSFDSKVTDKTSTIEWTTNEPATSRLDYGLTSEMLQLYLNSDFLTSHKIVLENLTPQTTYFFTLTSCDNKSNCNSIIKKTFTTHELITKPNLTQIASTSQITPPTSESTPSKNPPAPATPAVNQTTPIEKKYNVDFITDTGEILSIQVIEKITKINGKKLVEFTLQSSSKLSKVNAVFSTTEATEINNNGEFKEGKLTWSNLELNANEAKTLSFYANDATADSVLTTTEISLVKSTTQPPGLLTGFAVSSDQLTTSGAVILVLVLSGLLFTKLRKHIAKVKTTKNKLPPKMYEVKASSHHTFRGLKRQVFEH